MGDRYSRLLLDEGEDEDMGKDLPPWENPPAKSSPGTQPAPPRQATDLFNIPDQGLPPPEMEKDGDGYDRNNWSRLMRQARDMHPEIVEYLEVLYQTGLGLELNKKGKFYFTPGINENWTDERINEVICALYTYMAYLPAKKERGGSGSGRSSGGDVVKTLEAAIEAGGLLAVGVDGLRFDWSRARDQAAVDKARRLMDGVGDLLVHYIKRAEADLRKMGFVISLAEMSDLVDEN
jgi:hypothetical protein